MICFTLAMWLMNLLPVQQADQVLFVNAAISRQRMTALRELGRSNDIASDKIRWIAIDHDPKHMLGMIASSDQTTVRLRIGLSKRSTTESIEREIESLTRPEITSDEVASIMSLIRRAQWRVQSAKHSLIRLRLDQEHDLTIAATENVVDDSGPFRLTSHSKPISTPNHSMSQLEQRLQSDQRRSESDVAKLQADLERANSRTRGFFSMTGAPKTVAVPRPISILHACQIGLICISIFACSALPIHYHWNVKAKTFLQFMKRISISSALRHDVSDVHGLVHELNDVGVLFLGRIELQSRWIREGSNECESNKLMDHERVECDSAKLKSTRSLRWEVLVGRTADLALMVWVGIFLVRFVFDPMWRELVFRAPLASFSTVLSGL